MNLIPFGLRSDGVYIDADAATRGKACDCVCPSCGISLIARQGEVYASHFSHDPKGGCKEEIEACQFSFFVSVRYMLKQMLQETGMLMLPPFGIDFEGDKHVITKSAKITIEHQNITLDSYEQDVMFDIILMVSGRKLCIYISHPGRPAPIYNNLSGDHRTAVLCLELIHFSKLFSESHKIKSSTQLLHEWLETAIKGKHWIYNPRRKEWLEHQQSRKQHDESKTTRDRIKEQIAKIDQRTVEMYRCVFCKLDFEGSSLLNLCPKCNDHLSVIKKPEIAHQNPPKGKYHYR